MIKVFFLATIFVSFFSPTAFSQIHSLKEQITELAAIKKADIGVAVYGLESGDSISINGNRHYPMQSVFKFHIVLAVLNEVDKGRFSLHQKIYISKADLVPGIYSPLRDNYPTGNMKISLDTILAYTVSQSDNNGCDFLLKLIGGPKTVNDYMHGIGIKDISIKASETEMRKAWDVQFTNWTTPVAAVQLLRLFYNRKILSKQSHDFMMQVMIATSTGKDRIKGQLPAGTIVAHKTGTSATNDQGITAAVNDIGIVTLPNGKHFVISVFVGNSKENDAANARIIADIAKITWDYFSNKTK